MTLCCWFRVCLEEIEVNKWAMKNAELPRGQRDQCPPLPLPYYSQSSFFSFFEPPFSWDDYGGEGAEKWKCEETKIERLSLREFSQLVRSPQGGPGPRNRGRPTDDASLRIRRLQEKDTKAKKQWFALLAFPPLEEIPPHRFGKYMYNKQPDCKQKNIAGIARHSYIRKSWKLRFCEPFPNVMWCMSRQNNGNVFLRGNQEVLVNKGVLLIQVIIKGCTSFY